MAAALGPWRALPPRQATGRPMLFYCYLTRHVGWGKSERHACKRGYHLSRRTNRWDANGRVVVSGLLAARLCAERAAARLNAASPPPAAKHGDAKGEE